MVSKYEHQTLCCFSKQKIYYKEFVQNVHTLFGWDERNYTPFGNRPDLYGWGRTHFERRAFYGQASRGVTFQER